MVIATVWHLGPFKDVYAAARMREHPLFHLGITSMVIQALIIAYAYPGPILTGTPIAGGFKFGLLTGVLLGSYGVLVEAGKYNVGPVVGIAIGLIYGKQAP